jgi:hypothetical protein
MIAGTQELTRAIGIYPAAGANVSRASDYFPFLDDEHRARW